MIENIETKTIAELAIIIQQDWSQGRTKQIYFGAVPYLDAMQSMTSINDDYGLDTGKSIVAYFLGNAQTWKGETAREVKAELNRRLK
jgi:hypothetical protein